MPEEQQTTLRDTLSDAFEQAEAGTLPTQEDRARDEAGRFAKKEEPVPAPVETKATPSPDGVAAVQDKPLARPTTWKKDYLPIWDKIAAGNVKDLTPKELQDLARYTEQRETEYKTGVSTYKQEAMQAKEVIEAVTPFLGELNQNGLTPAKWITDVGHAHQILTRGSPEQKLQVLGILAQQYGVPLSLLQQGRMPPLVNDLLREIANLKQQVLGVSNYQQTQETSAIQQQVTAMASDEKYPHMKNAEVRETMAQLLERQLATDLHNAYEKAVYMVPEVRDEMLNQQLAQTQDAKTKAAREARSKAVSPRSATPSGQVTTTGAKSRRDVLSEQFDALGGGRV